MRKKKIVVKTVAYIPVFLTILLSLLFVYIVYTSEFFIQATIVPERGTGASAARAGFINAAYMILFSILGGMGVYLVIRTGKKNLVNLIFEGAMFFVSFFISYYLAVSFLSFMSRTWIYYYLGVSGEKMTIIQYILTTPYSEIGIVTLALLNAVVMIYALFREKRVVEANVALIFLGALTGAFLSVVLPLYTTIIMVIFISLYDIYAVFKGPIKKIAEMYGHPTGDIEAPTHEAVKKNEAYYDEMYELLMEMEDEVVDDDDIMDRMVYKSPYWDLGLGDLVFYSVLASTAFIFGAQYLNGWGLLAPWIPFIMTSIGVMFGLVITIRLLERNYMLPAMPIPVGFGLIMFFLTVLVYYL